MIAEIRLHEEEGDGKADRDRQRRREKAEDHARPEAKDLADIASQEHREDHGVGQHGREFPIKRLRCRHAPDVKRTEQHGNEVDEDNGGHKSEDCPIRRFFKNENKRGNEEQKRDISESVGDHEPYLFLRFREPRINSATHLHPSALSSHCRQILDRTSASVQIWAASFYQRFLREKAALFLTSAGVQFPMEEQTNSFLSNRILEGQAVVKCNGNFRQD